MITIKDKRIRQGWIAEDLYNCFLDFPYEDILEVVESWDICATDDEWEFYHKPINLKEIADCIQEYFDREV